MYEVRNRIHARNGATEGVTEEVSSPLLVYINILPYFTFYTRRLCGVW